VSFINNPFLLKWMSHDKGLKFLGFRLKKNSYVNKGWDWMTKNCKRRMSNFILRWLSKGGGQVLVKSMS
jgi:hypothetical protein